jgi:predicted homoserine dehydrogenase-like protein
MRDLRSRLLALPYPISVGIIGIGSIGKGLVLQSTITPGIKCVAIADVRLDRAIAAAEAFRLPYRVVGSLDEMHDAIRQQQLAVTEDADLIARCSAARVLIEASSALAPAARYALAAIDSDKHVVMMNAEADLMFGPHLLRCARRRGVVYTACDGDQPAVIRRLIAEIQLWGFELVMAGNIKGYLDRYVNPTSIAPEADKRHLDHKMCASYTDGTKLGVEMAQIANAFGMRVDVPGMHGPRVADVHNVFAGFDFKTLYAQRQPIVDYILGAKPSGGVFVIGYTEDAFQQFTLDWFPPDMGPGPFYVFYRPYHLGHIEAMATVLEAALDDTGVLQPVSGLRTNVYAYAKRDLRRSERLDGLGGYACYGLIENCTADRPHTGLPICLADGVTLRCDIPRDQPIRTADVDLNTNDDAVRLYQLALEADEA